MTIYNIIILRNSGDAIDIDIFIVIHRVLVNTRVLCLRVWGGQSWGNIHPYSSIFHIKRCHQTHFTFWRDFQWSLPYVECFLLHIERGVCQKLSFAMWLNRSRSAEERLLAEIIRFGFIIYWEKYLPSPVIWWVATAAAAIWLVTRDLQCRHWYTSLTLCTNLLLVESPILYQCQIGEFYWQRSNIH